MLVVVHVFALGQDWAATNELGVLCCSLGHSDLISLMQHKQMAHITHEECLFSWVDLLNALRHVQDNLVVCYIAETNPD